MAIVLALDRLGAHAKVKVSRRDRPLLGILCVGLPAPSLAPDQRLGLGGIIADGGDDPDPGDDDTAHGELLNLAQAYVGHGGEGGKVVGSTGPRLAAYHADFSRNIRSKCGAKKYRKGSGR